MTQRPTFNTRPFEPDYGCPPTGAAGVLAVVIVTGFLVGWLIHYLFGNVPMFCCGLNTLTLMFLGWAIGRVGGRAVRLGRVRSPSFAGSAGIIGMLASVFGQLLGEYQRLQVKPGFGQFIANITFPEWMPYAIGLFLGAGYAYSQMQAWAIQPYDPVADEWKTRKVLGRIDGIHPGKAVRAIADGDLTALTEGRLSEDDRPGIWLVAFVSPRGLPKSEIELEVQHARGSETVVVKHLGTWTYPGEAWAVLGYLFPGATEILDTDSLSR